ncbi:MAG: hypothetical protein AAB705_00500 [Patescibacteria group bacterium]
MLEQTGLNPLNKDEINAGPAIGYESRLDQAISGLLGLVGISRKAKEVVAHNTCLLAETGPRRAADAENSNYRKRKRRAWQREKKANK